jgi:hypothetical protein
MYLRLLIVLVTGLFFSSCINNDQQDVNMAKVASDSANFTTIQWIDSIKNFDKIVEGQKLEVVYHFKNTGNKPLVITDVVPGCGCTVADKPAEPIMPGKEGEIKAAFDSQGKAGQQQKYITVKANTKPVQSFSLQFMVEVEKKS